MTHFTLGAATITVINVGDIRADLAQWLQVSADDWPQYRDVLAQPIAVPMQCTHIALGDASVLVDAPRWSFTPGSEFFLPGYTPPPDLVSQLAEAGIRAEDITHVVITHAHFDHFNGLVSSPTPSLPQVAHLPQGSATRGRRSASPSGEGSVCFPNAWHYLGRADWERDDIQQALHDPSSMTSRTLGLLHQRNLLLHVTGDLRISDGITILAAPGETPGHQIVRVQSEGQTLYCIGDLYHHEVEFEQPGWQVSWADAEANRASRARFIEAALREDAVMVAAHIRGAGRLKRSATQLAWRSVEAE